MLRTHWHNRIYDFEHTNKKYTWATTAVVLGGAVIGGGAGYLGSQVGKKPKQVAANIYGPTETPEGKLYKKTLEERMAGLGLKTVPITGYNPSILSSATEPSAVAQRRSFSKYVAPAIYSRASAVGLGRSTIPISQERLGGQEVESDIAQRIANLSLANEEELAKERTLASEQERMQIESALNKYGPLVGDITGAENLKYGEAARIENINRGIEAENKRNTYNSIVNGAMSGAGGGMGSGGALSLLGGWGQSFSGGIGGQTQDYSELLRTLESYNNEIKRRNAARVNISEEPTDYTKQVKFNYPY